MDGPKFPVQLLTVPQVAKILQIARGKAYRMVASQQIPSVRFDRIVRVPEKELQEWIISQIRKGDQGVDGNQTR